MGRMFFFHKSNSGEIARRRLKQVLVSDQSGCSPGLIEGIREELIGVLSRYMELDSGKYRQAIWHTESPPSKSCFSFTRKPVIPGV